MSTSKNKKIKAEELDKKFDEGKEDIVDYLDEKSIKVFYPTHRVNVDFPQQILDQLDREAARVGVTRTSLIKLWIAERLDHAS